MGAIRLELITVATTSLLRTADAIEAVTSEPLTSVRGSADFSVGFIRLGEVLVEIAQSNRASGDHATFGGFVIVVEQLEQLTARLGPDVISEPRIAVQYGRHIATFRAECGPWNPRGGDDATTTATADTRAGTRVDSHAARRKKW